jgi:post-segregation antitoxin (ccd killing protein)
MPRLRKNGIIYTQTCVQIPENLRDSARKQGIGLSSTLTEALEQKVNKGNAGADNATNTEAPAFLPSTDERRGT